MWKPGWKPASRFPAATPGSVFSIAEQRGWKPYDGSLPRLRPLWIVIGIGHNYRVLIVRPAHRRPKQVAPAHQITDRVTFDQVAALPVDEGGERNEVEQTVGRYQQATGRQTRLR